MEESLPSKHYILHEDLQTPENGIAYFGPFPEDELTERLNDSYGDALASFGNLDGDILTDEYAGSIYINPPEFWYAQLDKMEGKTC